MQINVNSKRKVYILIQDCQVIGVWTNLKNLCKDNSESGLFPSYSKLSKQIATLRNDGINSPVLEIITRDKKAYQIEVQNLK